MKAGITKEKCIAAHGDLRAAECSKCKSSYSKEEFEASVKAGVVLRCKNDDCNGPIKPTVVFFGEQLPAEFY